MFSRRFRSATLLAVLLFVSLMWPFELVKNKLQSLEQQKYLWDQAASKEEAIQEMINFQNDLKPERYLDKAVIEIEQRFNLTRSGKSFNGDELVEFMRVELLQKYGVDPLFICWTNNEASWQGHYISPQMKLAADEIEYFRAFINRLALNDLLGFEKISGVAQLENLLNGFIFQAQNLGYEDFQDWLRKDYNRFLSSYYINSPLPNKTTRYLLDRFNFQFLLFCSRQPLKGGNFDYSISVGVLEKDIDTEIMIRQAVGRHDSQSRVSRHLVRGLRSGILYRNNKPGIVDVLPVEFIQLLANQKRQQSQKISKLSRKTQLMVAIETSSQAVEWWLSSSLVAFCERVIFLLLVSFWLRSCFFGFRIELSLRRKFMALLALALIPPGALSALYLEFVTRQEFSMRLSFAANRMQTRLDMLENLFMEAKNRQAFNNLGVKEMLSRFFAENDLNRLDLKAIKPYFEDNIDHSLFYERNGNFLSFAYNYVPNEPEKLDLGNGAKYFEALGVLDKSSAEVQTHLKRNQYAEGIVEGFLDLLDERKIMGYEGIGTPRLVKTNPIFRSHYFLVPETGVKPAKPKVFCVFGHKLKNVVFNLLRSSKQNLYEVTPEYTINMAIGERNSSDFEQLHFIGDGGQKQKFKELFRIAVRINTSSSSMVRTPRGVEFVSWRIFDYSPLMLAANCLVEPVKPEQSMFALFGPTVFVFVLLSILLLAEIANSLFLPPLNTLGNAARRIFENHDLNLKVEMENNDEFDLMGRSFNHMTRGLLERKHLLRFVSQRLASRLESDDHAGELLEVAVLACDLRGFTTITEENPPEQVVEILNEYFTEMETAIAACNGIIDKFVGDAIIAVFYPDRCNDPCLSAVQAAIAMRAKLTIFNQKRLKAGLFTLENGVGIEFGPAVSGSIGVSGIKMDYSITGSILRKANDLEALSKFSVHSKIVVSAKVKEALAEKFEFKQLDARSLSYELTSWSRGAS
ncbi:MAG: adenylate/guanylate cyclase domain-containing protein [Candidatus Rifleibacteriota bacterium]